MDLIPNYFFLDDKLYKKIRVVKSENYIVVWSYDDEKRMRFSYSSSRRELGKAYTLDEVSELIQKSKSTLMSYMKRKLIGWPSGQTYTIKNRRPGKWMWSEKDIIDLRDDLFELAPKNKYGEPYSNLKLVSKQELYSKMRGETSYYVRSEDGDFIKVWRAV